MKTSQVSIVGKDIYKAVHGKAPSGGNFWVFVGLNPSTLELESFSYPNILYSEAASKAKKEAALLRISSIRVMP